MSEIKKTRKYGMLADERDPRHKSSKDTKRWCRGRIGIEHRKAWSDDFGKFRTLDNLPYYELLSCVECGREFDRVRKTWTVATIIKAIRQARGLTQEQLGQACGMEQSRIAALEAGHNDVTLKTLTRIAKAFNVTLALEFWNCGTIALNKESRGDGR